MNKGQMLYQKAKGIIPSGTQLFSKRPELHCPSLWPPYYRKAKGCEVWDIDGNKYIDMSYMGFGSCALGYADNDVDKAVKEAIDSGSMSTLNCPEEVELAELLCELHSWAEMVRYARTGGEAMAIVVRIARAKTGKDIVAFCGYSGWHDWYLAANLGKTHALDGHLMKGLEPLGVPRCLRGTALPFHYNKIDELKTIVSKHSNEIGAIVLEPVRNQEPRDNFLEEVREIATMLKVPLIFDEITSGWRENIGGIHLLYGVTPDIAIFAKAMSNGYPMAAIIGRADVMESAQDSFISSTYWSEKIGTVAALATIKKYKRYDIPKYLAEIGERVRYNWAVMAAVHELKTSISGILPLLHLHFGYADSQAVRTLFTQGMLSKGFLATDAFYASYAHKNKHLVAYFKALDETFAFIAKAIKKGNVAELLKGGIAQSGFQRLA